MSVFSSLHKRRWVWGAIAALSLGLVLLAHDVFQVWLYMKPCEQCVYIRFALVMIGLGALLAFIRPACWLLRFSGYGFGLWGAIYGIYCSVRLHSIHFAVHSDDPMALFGMQGCSMQPHYPFGLPLEKWAPDWFMPTGDCGYDASVVPHGVDLSPLQKSLIDMYDAAGGWYLIPSKHFMTMADCCVLAFGVAIAIYIALMIIDAASWRRA